MNWNKWEKSNVLFIWNLTLSLSLFHKSVSWRQWLTSNSQSALQKYLKRRRVICYPFKYIVHRNILLIDYIVERIKSESTSFTNANDNKNFIVLFHDRCVKLLLVCRINNVFILLMIFGEIWFDTKIDFGNTFYQTKCRSNVFI